MLKLEAIKKSFYMEKSRIDVLNGVNLHIKSGENVALTGRSGAGKTTLLNIMATLEKPDSGKIFINGVDPLSLKDRKLSQFRNREIGIVFQFHHLLPEFTALENVALSLMIDGKKREAFDKAEEVIELVGLKERLNHKPAELSGGEQQRVAIARALVTSPSVLFLDEPTGNLDEFTGRKVLDLILSLSERNKLATIFVTHNRRFAEEMDSVFHLENGEIYAV